MLSSRRRITAFTNTAASTFYGIFRALIKNTQAGRIRQGASTVTQQLARNVFDLRDRTYDRKILEVFLAMRIERFVPKKKIMELYLNRVYFGGGLYGAEAAAKGYFGKPAKELSVGEAAMLAALLKSPNNLSPWHNLEAATQERDFVLGRMVEEHKISQQVADTARATTAPGTAEGQRGVAVLRDRFNPAASAGANWARVHWESGVPNLHHPGPCSSTNC